MTDVTYAMLLQQLKTLLIVRLYPKCFRERKFSQKSNYIEKKEKLIHVMKNLGIKDDGFRLSVINPIWNYTSSVGINICNGII